MATVRLFQRISMHHGRVLQQTLCSVRPSNRLASTESFKYLRLLQNDKIPGVTTLEMCKQSGNSLDSDLISELTQALHMLESDKHNKGLIITSAAPGMFSTGLDIMSEVYKSNRDDLVKFWKSMQRFFVKLYVSPLVTIAAINGACVDGGCVLSIACDHRIIANDIKHKIGLNGVQLGVPPPNWVVQWFVLTVGHRHAEKAIQLGTLHSPAEAKRVGLVDHVVPMERIEEYSMYKMEKCLKVPGRARQCIKEDIRLPLAKRILSMQSEDTESMLSLLTSDSVQRAMGAYMEIRK